LCEDIVLEAIDLGENRNKRHYNLLSGDRLAKKNLRQVPSHLDREHLY
jgi:hypothetical protein